MVYTEEVQLDKDSSQKSLILSLGIICIVLGIIPGADQLNPAKLTILGILAAATLIHLNLNVYRKIEKVAEQLNRMKIFVLILSSFIVSLLVAWIFTPQKTIGLFGEAHRNLGFLNYFFLVIIGLYAALIISLKNMKNFIVTATFLGVALSIYGLLQYFNIDLINWQKPSRWIVLTTGNPDLASSLLAILATLVFSSLFIYRQLYQRLLITGLLGAMLLVIVLTRTLQGLIGLEFGIFFILAVALIRNRKYLIALLTLQSTAAIFTGLGVLNYGPLKNYLHKISVIDRGYDWQAAIGMFKAHPFTGVGLDSYGSYFAQYRSSKYPLIFGYKQTVNNAHNILLEFLATGGIFVAITYLALLAYVASRAYVTLQNLQGRNQLLFSGIVAAWLVFVAQSLISIDSPVLSIWGWTLGGVIVGISLKELSIRNQDQQ
jgi:O-antigen ligase